MNKSTVITSTSENMVPTATPVSPAGTAAEAPGGQDGPVSGPAKRKADDADLGTSANGNDTEDKAPPAKKRKKATETAVTTPKKRVPRPKKDAQVEKAASPPKRRSKKVAQPVVTPPPPPPPAKLDKVVLSKVQQIKKFVDSDEKTKLERDSEKEDLITIPQHILLGAIMTMLMHYQIGIQEDASLTYAEQAIVNRFQRPIGSSEEEFDWVTIDASIQTQFEADIHQKIARHGLENVNLLEIELELTTRHELRHFGLLQHEDDWRPIDRLLSTFEETSTRTRTEKNESVGVSTSTAPAVSDLPTWRTGSLNSAAGLSGEREIGKVGVCVAPIGEIC